MRTGLTKQEKTTDIWFDEKDPLIHIRTHNTDLKKRLAAYAGQHPDQCRQTDADPDTGCMEFEIRKGRFSFRLTAPYSEERRERARQYAKKTIMDYIAGKYPDLVPLYDEIYNKHNRSYFEALEVKAEKMAKKYDCAFVDNEMPYGRVPQGHPVIVDYFYHEEIRGTENTGKRNR